MTAPYDYHIGVDYHKSYSHLVVQDSSGKALRSGRVKNDRQSLGGFLERYRDNSHAVVEATRNWMVIYDWLDDICDDVVLAHPLKVKAIADAKIKTDKIDATVLAHLLRADLVPEAWAPNDKARKLRVALRERMFYVRLRTMTKNRIVTVFDRYPEQTAQLKTLGDLFGKAGRVQLAQVKVSEIDRIQIDRGLEFIDDINARIKQSEATIRTMTKANGNVKLLKTIPGIGEFFARLIDAEIDDIARFRNPKKLAAYAGLVPSTYSSGGKTFHGKIIKQGNKWLRWAFVEAVTPAITSDAQLRAQLRRDKLLAFFAGQPACIVAMEACSSAHYWAREIGKFGHTVRLIAPAYVKPFVKRQKNDAADAEAICEAAQRPTMRFVSVKSEEEQASAAVFRARDLLVRQRTQTINALRGHLAEYGLIVAQGPTHVTRLVLHVEDSRSKLPEATRMALAILVDTLKSLDQRIQKLDVEIARRAREDEDARRLATIPGVGPITATALIALAPGAAGFKRGRDFAAWLGLTPLQRSTGGKQKLGETSKMGERTLRRLLIIGASAVVLQARRRGTPEGSWLGRMLARKPPMLVTVALANKMARIVWALMAKGGVYKAPAVAA